MKKLNQKKYWFKRKYYGWGWYPASWEGWTVLAFYVSILVMNAFRLESPSLPPQRVISEILPETSFLTVLLIALCYCKGETPRWQWGEKKKKK